MNEPGNSDENERKTTRKIKKTIFCLYTIVQYVRFHFMEIIFLNNQTNPQPKKIHTTSITTVTEVYGVHWEQKQ